MNFILDSPNNHNYCFTQITTSEAGNYIDSDQSHIEFFPVPGTEEGLEYNFLKSFQHAESNIEAANLDTFGADLNRSPEDENHFSLKS